MILCRWHQHYMICAGKNGAKNICHMRAAVTDPLPPGFMLEWPGAPYSSGSVECVGDVEFFVELRYHDFRVFPIIMTSSDTVLCHAMPERGVNELEEEYMETIRRVYSAQSINDVFVADGWRFLEYVVLERECRIGDLDLIVGTPDHGPC